VPFVAELLAEISAIDPAAAAEQRMSVLARPPAVCQAADRGIFR
jgi:hypothetical protein